MSITQAIQQKLELLSAGQIFGYQDLPDYRTHPAAVTKAVSRLVATGRIKRLSKGKFYTPKEGVLGPQKPSDSELLKTVLYKNGQCFGYVTGPSLYNKLGLTTQVPRTVTVACNGGRQVKEFGTIRVKTVAARAPVKEQDTKLLQYLDVLKDINKILDSDTNLILQRMRRYIDELSNAERNRLVKIARIYYTPQTKALVGLLVSSLGFKIKAISEFDLNPVTTYKIGINEDEWPQAEKWNIR